MAEQRRDDPPAGSGPPGGDVDRRSRLLAVKLRALVTDHTGASGDDIGTPSPFAPGAGLVVGDTAWTLLDDRPAQRLGSALAWSLRRGASSLDVIAETDTGVLARRATQFSFPVTVWRVEGRSLVPATPDAFDPRVAASPSHLALRELIAAGGASPVVEHGVVAGEVRGLEVCRVVDDPDVVGADGAVGARLEVGVGVHDREAFQMMHGDTPTVESLSRVVDAVRAHRAPGAPRHPFNRMAPERLVRWRVEDDPGLLDASSGEPIGLRSVSPAEPPVPRSSVIDSVPCVAHAVDRHGAPVVVVCSSGVDLDLVPYAADARLAASGAFAPAATTGVDRPVPVRSEPVGLVRTVLVLPARDRLAVTEELAELLVQSVELVSLD